MTKDFVSIMDLMPKIFELAKRNIRGVFNVRRYPSQGDLFQYDVLVSDEGQKQLSFTNRRYTLPEVYADLTGEPVEENNSYTSEEEYKRGHTPYILGQAYDVPEILEIHFLRNAGHVDYITEEYLQFLESMYYHYVLAYVRSCDTRDEIEHHDYATDKESNIIYRLLGDMVFQLDPDNDDMFTSEVKEMVLEKADKLARVKKSTKSDKNILGFILYPSRDLDDLLDYHEFYDRHSRNYGASNSQTYESLTHYLPMFILHIAIAQEKQTYIGSSYPEYVKLVDALPIRLTRSTDVLPDDWSIADEMEKHLTLSPDDRLYMLSYGSGVGTSSNYHAEYGRSEYLDGIINQALYARMYDQIRLMMFGNEDVPVPIDNLPQFESEIWRNEAGLRLSLNASSLEWSEQNERD